MFYRNAFCLGMLDAIKSNLLHELDCNVKVIVISANGKVFSSGHDLKELVRQSPLIKVNNEYQLA